MANADNYAASLDPRVIAQVTASIYSYIQTVEAEGTGVTNHAARLAFANKVSLGQQNLTPLILAVCSFASVNAASTDTTVNNSVATLWNLWSAV